nr:ring-infected erythrocyte surface antigen-like [Leptinotarsa decemlineata]
MLSDVINPDRRDKKRHQSLAVTASVSDFSENLKFKQRVADRVKVRDSKRLTDDELQEMAQAIFDNESEEEVGGDADTSEEEFIEENVDTSDEEYKEKNDQSLTSVEEFSEEDGEGNNSHNTDHVEDYYVAKDKKTLWKKNPIC